MCLGSAIVAPVDVEFQGSCLAQTAATGHEFPQDLAGCMTPRSDVGVAPTAAAAHAQVSFAPGVQGYQEVCVVGYPVEDYGMYGAWAVVPHIDADEQVLGKTKLCKFFLRGHCSHGSTCTYAHGKHELKQKPNLFRTEMCFQFLSRGSCAHGASCKYAHSPEELQAATAAPPEPMPEVQEVTRVRSRGGRGGRSGRRGGKGRREARGATATAAEPDEEDEDAEVTPMHPAAQDASESPEERLARIELEAKVLRDQIEALRRAERRKAALASTGSSSSESPMRRSGSSWADLTDSDSEDDN